MKKWSEVELDIQWDNLLPSEKLELMEIRKLMELSALAINYKFSDLLPYTKDLSYD